MLFRLGCGAKLSVENAHSSLPATIITNTLVTVSFRSSQTVLSGMVKKSFYVVARGANPGIYHTWEECKAQVSGYSGAVYKGYSSRQEAETFLAANSSAVKAPAPVAASAPVLYHTPSGPSHFSGFSNSDSAYSKAYAHCAPVDLPPSYEDTVRSSSSLYTPAPIAPIQPHTSAPTQAPTNSSKATGAQAAAGPTPRASAASVYTASYLAVPRPGVVVSDAPAAAVAEPAAAARAPRGTKRTAATSAAGDIRAIRPPPADACQMARSPASIVLNSRLRGTVLVHTDGSCSINPGYCGAGISIEAPVVAEADARAGADPALSASRTGVRLDVALGYGSGTNNYVELRAIGESLRYVDSLPSRAQCTGVQLAERDVDILTDSNWAINVLTGHYTPRAPLLVGPVAEVRSQIDAYEQKHGAKVNLHWVKGHAGIPGNETADKLANKGTEYSKMIGSRSRWEQGREAVEPKVVSITRK